MNFISRNKPYLAISVSLIIFFFPFFLSGRYTVFPIIDNLDCLYVWNKIAASPKYLFAYPSAIVAEYMNGIPRFTLENGINVLFVLNIFLPSFYACAIYLILIHTVACFSMYFFADKYLCPKDKYVSVLAGLLYGLQNFVYAYSFSLALLPVVISSFITFYKKKPQAKEWLFIILFPFLSNFQSVGIFIVLGWGITTVFFMTQRKAGWKLILPAVIMAIVYYINNFPTLNNLLFNTYFVSHRSGFLYHPETVKILPGWHWSMFSVLKLLFHYKIFILGALVLFMLRKKKHSQARILTIILLLIVLFEMEYFLINNNVVEFLKGHSTILKMFHFNKIFVFKPFLLAVAYAICLGYIFSYLKNKTARSATLIAAVIFLSSGSLHWKPFLGKTWTETGRPFEGYYSPDLFRQIKKNIGLPENEYKVACFGIHPAAALYNGLYTVDGYINNYPLSYKEKFRKTIEKDLKIIHEKYGFKEWDFETTGHRCYLQNDVSVTCTGGSMLIDKTNPAGSPQIVHWNISALQELGCRYIISSVELKTDEQNKLQIAGHFENQFYSLFLYKI